MLHLGDIKKMSGYDIPPVDVITGGSPHSTKDLQRLEACLTGSVDSLCVG